MLYERFKLELKTTLKDPSDNRLLVPSVNNVGVPQRPVRLGTRVGREKGGEMGCPSWPMELFPQAYKLQSFPSARLCSLPAAIAVHAVTPGGRGMSTGL